MVNFFIDRPIFAWVIAIVIMLAGGLAILSLPVAQYPAIAPPLISISVTYPGASAETVQSTVVQVIEQQLSGLDHLRYFSSDRHQGRQHGDRADVRAGHGPGHRPGPGAEQTLAGRAAAADRGAAAGHPRHEGRPATSCWSSASFQPTTAWMPSRHRRFHRLQRAGSTEPHAGCRRLPGVRFAVRHAHLARSGQAQQLRAHAGRREQRDRQPERAGLVRRDRRPAGGCRATSSMRP